MTRMAEIVESDLFPVLALAVRVFADRRRPAAWSRASKRRVWGHGRENSLNFGGWAPREMPGGLWGSVVDAPSVLHPGH